MKIQLIIILILVLALFRKVYLPKVQSDNIFVQILRFLFYVQKIEITHGENDDPLAKQMLIEDIRRSERKDKIMVFSGNLYSNVFMDEEIKNAVIEAINTKMVKFEIITERAPDNNIFSELLRENKNHYADYINLRQIISHNGKKLKHFRIVGNKYYYLEHKHENNQRIFERVINNRYNTDYLINRFESLKRLAY